LFAREFALFHGDRMRLHTAANLFKFAHCTAFVVQTPLLNPPQPCEMGLQGLHLDVMLGACCRRKLRKNSTTRHL